MSKAMQKPGKTRESAKHHAPRPAAKRTTASAAQQSDQLGELVQHARLAPDSLTQRDVLQLQRALGNRAVSQMLAGQKQETRSNPDTVKNGVGSLTKIQRVAVDAGTIQRCVHCGDSSCVKGEKCGWDRSNSGLFSASAAATAPAVLPYNSTNAKKQSGKAVGMELEHVIPGATLRQLGEGAGYKSEYTVPTPVAVHRGAVAGAGGGISSTGSSDTSKEWATHLASQPTDFERVKSALTEQVNAYIMKEAFTETVALQLKDWLIAQEAQEHRITAQERATLLNALMDRYLSQKKK
jgi:hypothetical protein